MPRQITIPPANPHAPFNTGDAVEGGDSAQGFMTKIENNFADIYAAAAYKTNASAVSATATAAQVTGGVSFVELDLTGNPAGPANMQMPTAAAIIAVIAGLATGAAVIGHAWRLRVKNSGNSDTWTITTNTGITLAGTMTIATATWREFLIKVTSATTVSVQNLGGASVI
jgi:hypothetical protein